MKFQEKTESIKLRQKGYSLKEISQKLNVSKSSVSVWVRDIKLSDSAHKRLLTKVSAGQIESASNKKQRTQNILDGYYNEACFFLKGIKIGTEESRLMCSLIYWCEGGKTDNRMVQFTNSDPNLIVGFLKLMRESYPIEESKFRACIHLHQYHDKQKQIEFWSGKTKISKNQFIKPYFKKNTGKRIRDNYQGCLQVRYYDANIARQILLLGKAFFNNLGA